MNPLTVLQTVISNKHTSIAGIVYLVAKYGTQALAIWWPAEKEKLDATANLVEGAAVAYGLFAAGDATKSVTKDEGKALAVAVETGDTSHLPRTIAPTPPVASPPPNP